MNNYKKKTGEIRGLGLIDQYEASLKKKLLVILISAIALILLFFISVFVGSSGISFVDTIQAIFGQGNPTNVTIVWNIRMPRIIAALLVGAGLALSGLVMQTTLRNPMASPTTLGVSNAAVLGANVALIIAGGGTIISTNVLNNPYLVSTFAFVFAIASVAFILALLKIRNFAPEVVVLAGIGLGALCTGVTTLIQYFSSDTQLANAIYWTFGDLSRATYTENIILAVVVGISLVVFIIFRWNYNAMRAGDDVAKSLGVKVNLTRFLSLALASLITAVSIAFFGIIGFIGIIAPHIMKRIIGNDHRYLIPTSAIGGAFVLLFADTISRVIVPGVSIPVGAITAIIGAPVFIFIIFAKKGSRA